MNETIPHVPGPPGPSTAWNLTRLTGSLILELILNGLQMMVFLFRRGTYRRRIQDLLLRPHAPGGLGEVRLRATKAAAVACCALLTLLGCCGPNLYRAGGRQPGTEFSMAELVDSTVTIVAMPDWKDSLTSDLEWIVDDSPCEILETFNLWGW